MTKRFLFLLLLFSSTLSQSYHDQLALCKITTSLSGLPTSWRCDLVDNACYWEGIKCTDDRISEISVVGTGPNQTKVGTIPTEVGLMVSLTKITIIGMGLKGTIPPSLTSLPDLAALYLNDNTLSGEIPVFPSLLVLNLRYNNFDSFPFLAPTLVSLDLSFNTIGSTLPETVGPNLVNLNLASNALSGTLPPWISQLQLIDISHNRFKDVDPISNLSTTTTPTQIWFPQEVDECAARTHDCNQRCVDGWHPPLSYTCSCRVGYAFLDDRTTCLPCAGEFTPNFVYTGRFPAVTALGYSDSTLIYSTCSFCDNGSVVLKRDVLFRNECEGLETFHYETCSFACANQTGFTMSKDSIQTLVQELQRGDFLAEMMIEFFGVNVTLQRELTSKKRFLGIGFLDWFLVQDSFQILFDPCNSSWVSNKTNFEDLRTLVEAVCLDIIPNIPTFSVRIQNCALVVNSQDPDSITPIVIAIVLSAVFLLCGLGFGCYFAINRKIKNASPVRRLPPEIAWSYKKYEKRPKKWDHRGTKKNRYFFRELDPQTKSFQRVLHFFQEKLGGKDLLISRIEAIYNQNLLNSFVNMKTFLETRITVSPGIFQSDMTGGDSSRNWVLENYKALTLQFDWNKKDSHQTAIIPVLHGCNMLSAWSIAETGFAAVSLLDAGYFGKGMYFTTYANYTIPYFCQEKEPTIILSWAVCGNVYPVIEGHLSNKSLKGCALQGISNSHYVVTKRSGECIATEEKAAIESFNEIVIGQESQITPAFLLYVSKSNFKGLISQWQRSVPGSDDDSPSYRSDDGLLVTRSA